MGRIGRIGFLSLIMLISSACSLSTDGVTTDEQQTFSGPPVVQISSPLPNAIYLEGTSVNIISRIENAGPDLARVEVSLDGAIIGTATSGWPAGAASFTVEQGWPAVAGEHTISVVAYRNDGTSSEPKSVTINIVAEAPSNNASGGEDDAQTAPTQASAPTTANTSADNPANVQPPPTATNPPPPSNTPAPPTSPPASNTPSVPTARMLQGVNVRSGPGLAFNPPIGSLAANDQAEILAVNTDSTWYKIRYYNGEGWVFAQLVSTTGNLASLPIDPGPPTPFPTNTPPPPPPTAPPSQVNLVVANIQTVPHPLICNQSSEIQVTVRNDGSAASTSGGLISIRAIRVSDGQELARTETPFPALQPGQTHTAGAFLTVSTYVGELQRIVVTVDHTNQVPESNENDNARNDADYALQKGGCP